MECKIVWKSDFDYHYMQAFLNEMRKLRIVDVDYIEWTMEDLYYGCGE